jgi:hypothetical protein
VIASIFSQFGDCLRKDIFLLSQHTSFIDFVEEVKKIMMMIVKLSDSY